MNHLKLHDTQISLRLPATALDRDADHRRSAIGAREEREDALSAARGIMLALGLSACLWLVVLTALAVL